MVANTVEILTSGDIEQMQALAENESCSSDALVVLSQSLTAEIRASVARNSAAPRIADELLAKDDDVTVRAAVARKAAMRAADEPAKQTEKLRTAALQVLTRLIADQEVRVRQVIAEEIKASPHVPKHLASQLARDKAIEVSGPVLEYSPLLTDEDLIDIIAGYIHSPTLEAVARRKPVSATVAERLTEILDTTSIAALLSNPDSLIRENALEKIVDAARSVETWHEPLVKRPSLPAQAIGRICGFVADSLLKVLSERPDLDDDSRRLVALKVSERLDAENAEISDEDAVLSEIRDELMVRQKLGKLNAAYLADAATSGKHTVVTVALGLLAKVDHAAAQRAIVSRSPKMITALCWKAGLPMSLARLLQELVGKITPQNCLSPADDGGYPLDDSTLEWNFALCTDED